MQRADETSASRLQQLPQDEEGQQQEPPSRRRNSSSYGSMNKRSINSSVAGRRGYEEFNPVRTGSDDEDVAAAGPGDDIMKRPSVPCPTCRGTGKIPKESRGPIESTLITDSNEESTFAGSNGIPAEESTFANSDNTVVVGDDETEDEMNSVAAIMRDDEGVNDAEMDDETLNSFSNDGLLDLARGIPLRVRAELRQYRITQDILARAALDKSQGYLSDLLRRFTADRAFNKSTRRHLLAIGEFLDRPAEQRCAMYAACRRDDRTDPAAIARREYRSTMKKVVPPGGVTRSITAHAAAVMSRYLSATGGESPDERGIPVIADALNLNPATVRKYFDQLQSKKSQQIDGNCDNQQQLVADAESTAASDATGSIQ
ncbi:uncharacterized protein LOC141911975 isoform X2 [Tubulanus polymorphus]|uniref:uncharacterized protein LOC141911975 isoform X2 n=1 Tax=Tubulanus polymorphus TaxID=672921 RepID=UPI003DA4DD14